MLANDVGSVCHFSLVSAWFTQTLYHFLNQQGVPFKPLIKDVKDKKCGVYIVTWKPPSSESGGGPVTSYQAQVRKEQEAWQNCSTNSTQPHSCVFGGLDKKARYRVRVRALNIRGASDWSCGPMSLAFSGTASISDDC